MPSQLTRRGFIGGSAGVAALMAALSAPDVALASEAYLSGVDVSSIQSDIALDTLPGDFAIIKATQNTGYTNPYFKRQIESAIAGGKLTGTYHYAGGSDPTSEADHFLAVAADYIGRSMLVLDWESYQNSHYGYGDANWVATWRQRVYDKCGIWPVVYASLADAYELGLDSTELWVAQYASYNKIYGYEGTPWNEGAYTCAMRQYTSSGILDGWDGVLDLNKFYGSSAQWEAYATATPVQTIVKRRYKKMECIIQPNGESHLFYFDGSHIHSLGHPDEATALDMIYQATHDGEHIPTFAFGGKTDPWAARLVQAINAGDEGETSF
jgi:GH25 family lysozyme M1 (1,4-beta-N-acetylmuramidase)